MGYVKEMQMRCEEDVRRTSRQRCKTCNNVKSWNDFYRHKNYKSGYFRECKACSDKRRANNWRKNPNGKLVATVRKFGITVLGYKKIYTAS